MKSQNVLIPFNFKNAWICKTYYIYCNFLLKIVEIFVLTMFHLIGIIFYFVNIFPQQFSLQIARTLSIEFVELLHYL